MTASLHLLAQVMLQRAMHMAYLICNHCHEACRRILCNQVFTARPIQFTKSAPFMLHVRCAVIACLRGSLPHGATCLPRRIQSLPPFVHLLYAAIRQPRCSHYSDMLQPCRPRYVCTNHCPVTEFHVNRVSQFVQRGHVLCEGKSRWVWNPPAWRP